MSTSGRRLFKANEGDAEENRHLYEVDENGEIIDSIGSELRQARLRTGYEIQDISNSLRIRRAHLEALEDGRYSDLPGAPYAVGFVRSYAKFLGLDADAVVERFKSDADNVDHRPTLDFPAPTDEGRMPKTWLILVALVLAGIAYGGWQYFANHNTTNADRGGDVPEQLASLATETPVASAPDIVPADDETALSEGFASPSETAMSTESSGLAAGVEANGSIEPGTVDVSVPEEAAIETGLAETPLVSPDGGTPAVETSAVIDPAAPDPQVESTVVPMEAAVPASEEWSEDVGSPSPAIEVTADGLPAPAPIAAEETASSVAGAETVVTVIPPADPPASEAVSVGDNLWDSATGSGGDQADVSEGEVSEAAEADNLASLDGLVPVHEPKVYGADNEDARIIIRSIGDSWVQVQGPDNELLLTRILHEGDSYRVPDRSSVVMMTGNAGALELWVDDTRLPSLGPVGLVRRDIVLDPEALMAAGGVE